MRILSFLFFYLLIFCTNAQIAKDSIYKENIRTVQFYLNTGTAQSPILPPVLELGKESKLTLEFDVLKEEVTNYLVRIHAYNENWTQQSFLMNSDFLEEYNEFFVTGIRNSFNTRIPYIHYTVDIPPILRSGNFLVSIYDEDENVVISRRFMVFQNKIQFMVESSYGQNILLESTQQFNFSLNLPPSLLNPAQRIVVVIRQNGNWNQTKVFRQPTFLQEYRFDYRLFKEEDSFIAGNEFRVFDSRSIRFKGNRIGQIVLHEKINSIFLLEDSIRYYQYLTMRDINGQYLIDQYEYGDGTVNADYLLTNFTLKTPKISEPIYVYGALSDWKLKEEFRMQYDDATGRYYCSPMLKQGYYNYQYIVLSNKKLNVQKIEGSHYQTENGYEIFIYYKNPSNIDELIGYKQFSINR